jgi:hypothetical protein
VLVLKWHTDIATSEGVGNYSRGSAGGETDPEKYLLAGIRRD